MSNYKTSIIIIVVIAAAIMVGLFFSEIGYPFGNSIDEAELPNQGGLAVSSDPNDRPAELESDSLANYDSVSLPALMNQEFDGRELTLGQVLADNEAYTRYFITYKSGELTISGIMNVPKGDGPFPVAILNHGYIDPAVYTNGRGLKREQDFLARRGYVVLHSDYRNHASSDKDPLAEENLRLGYVIDVINAVEAVKNSESSFFDKNRIGMVGHSMGGGVALGVMVTKPDLVDAFVFYAAVSANAEDNFNRWIVNGRSELAQAIVAKFGSPEDNPKLWQDLSAETFFNLVQAPVQIHHGTEDESVPLMYSENLKANLDKAGKSAELFVYEGEKHEFIPQWQLMMERVDEFFQENLN